MGFGGVGVIVCSSAPFLLAGAWPRAFFAATFSPPPLRWNNSVTHIPSWQIQPSALCDDFLSELSSLFWIYYYSCKLLRMKITCVGKEVNLILQKSPWHPIQKYQWFLWARSIFSNYHGQIVENVASFVINLELFHGRNGQFFTILASNWYIILVLQCQKYSLGAWHIIK